MTFQVVVATYYIDPSPLQRVSASIVAVHCYNQCDHQDSDNASPEYSSYRSTDSLVSPYLKPPQRREELAVGQAGEYNGMDGEGKVVQLHCRLRRALVAGCILFAD